MATRMMLGDLVRYLPDDILTKVGSARAWRWASKRAFPLIDHRVVAFASPAESR